MKLPEFQSRGTERLATPLDVLPQRLAADQAKVAAIGEGVSTGLKLYDQKRNELDMLEAKRLGTRVITDTMKSFGDIKRQFDAGTLDAESADAAVADVIEAGRSSILDSDHNTRIKRTAEAATLSTFGSVELSGHNFFRNQAAAQKIEANEFLTAIGEGLNTFTTDVVSRYTDGELDSEFVFDELSGMADEITTQAKGIPNLRVREAVQAAIPRILASANVSVMKGMAAADQDRINQNVDTVAADAAQVVTENPDSYMAQYERGMEAISAIPDAAKRKDAQLKLKESLNTAHILNRINDIRMHPTAESLAEADAMLADLTESGGLYVKRGAFTPEATAQYVGLLTKYKNGFAEAKAEKAGEVVSTYTNDVRNLVEQLSNPDFDNATDWMTAAIRQLGAIDSALESGDYTASQRETLVKAQRELATFSEFAPALASVDAFNPREVDNLLDIIDTRVDAVGDAYDQGALTKVSAMIRSRRSAMENGIQSNAATWLTRNDELVRAAYDNFSDTFLAVADPNNPTPATAIFDLATDFEAYVQQIDAAAASRGVNPPSETGFKYIPDGSPIVLAIADKQAAPMDRINTSNSLLNVMIDEPHRYALAQQFGEGDSVATMAFATGFYADRQAAIVLRGLITQDEAAFPQDKNGGIFRGTREYKAEVRDALETTYPNMWAANPRTHAALLGYITAYRKGLGSTNIEVDDAVTEVLGEPVRLQGGNTPSFYVSKNVRFNSDRMAEILSEDGATTDDFRRLGVPTAYYANKNKVDLVRALATDAQLVPIGNGRYNVYSGAVRGGAKGLLLDEANNPYVFDAFRYIPQLDTILKRRDQ